LSVLEAMRQSAGWPRAASAQPTFLTPDREAAKADQRPALQALQGRNGQPGTAGRSRPGRGRPSAAGVRARRGPEPAVIVVALVRAGSVQHRKPLVIGGHERSRPANQNRRSHCIHRNDLRRQNSMGPGSSPSSSGRDQRPHPPAHPPGGNPGRLLGEAPLGHVWGMKQGTARDNSGAQRAIVLWP
jgi:hypothetical protein